MDSGRPSSDHVQADPAEQLRAELREIKKSSGLSYARLGAGTYYGKSSWERWLNGKQFPPRAAIESLSAILERDVADLTALWELAAAARAAANNPPEPPQSESPAADPGNAVPAEVTTPDPDKANTAQATTPDPNDATPAQSATPDPAPDPAQQPTTTEEVHNSAPKQPATAHDTPSRPGRRRVPLLLAGLVAAIAAVALLVAFEALSADHSAPASPASGHRVVTASPAVAASPGCKGGGCQGKDPLAMHCSQDAQTLALVTNSHQMVVEMRYSKACAAAWGRITYASKGAVVDVNSSAGQTVAMPVHWGNDVYSPMVDASPSLEIWACGTTPDGSNRTCTQHIAAPTGP
ncbi:DUF2690 domain-containing protein [Streptomyces sp. NPDC054933]